MILCREEFAKEARQQRLPRHPGRAADARHRRQGGLPAEALQPEFKEYQRQIVDNAQALAEALAARGFRLVSGGTDNHLMLVDSGLAGITGKDGRGGAGARPASRSTRT